jgi:hypothetical protein
MTRYSRSVIPGRSNEAGAADMDSLVFGDKPKINTRPANDAGEGNIEPMSDNEAINFVERAASDRRKGAKRRGSDFAPLPGEARPSDGGAKRGPLLLVGALIVVAVFGLVVWNAYRDGVRPEDSAVAPELADAGPFKSKPEEAAAGASAPPAANDATVFDQVEAKPTAKPTPETHEPVTPKAPAAMPPAAAGPVSTIAPAPKLAPVTPPANGAVGTTKPAATPTVGNSVAMATPTVGGNATQTVGTTKPAAQPTVGKPVATVASAAPAPSLDGAYTPAFSNGGKFVVQIGAPDSQSGAEAEWAKAARKAPDLFGSAERIIQQTDVNGKTVYRLRAGAFATGQDADAFCNAFKAKGGACYRTTR